MGGGKQHDDVEYQALLPEKQHHSPTLGVVNAADEVQRQWHGDFCGCCGDCSLSSLGTCFVVLMAPYVAFGHNMRRAFGKVGWKQGLLYFMVLCFLPRVFSDAAQLVYPVLVNDPACYNEQHQHHTPDNPLEGPPNGEVFFRVSASVDMDSSSRCDPPVVVLLLVFLALGIYVAGLVMAIRRRTQLRQKFNIPGSCLTDCLAWWCCTPCALCQETRTLAHNNVLDGVWHGPTTAISTSSGTIVTPAGQPILAAPALHTATALPLVREV